jgi:hypothetical protein
MSKLIAAIPLLIVALFFLVFLLEFQLLSPGGKRAKTVAGLWAKE